MNGFVKAAREGRFLFVGHRGAYGECPENSLSGFRRALEIGCDGLETDLHGTLDGRIVLMHDDNVFTTTVSTGLLTQMSFEQTRKINVASKFRPDWPFEPVPTLEELIEIAKQKEGFLLNLELKDYPEVIGDRAYEICDRIIEIVEREGMRERILLNTFSCGLVRYIYNKYGDIYPIHTFYPECLMKGEFGPDIYEHSLYVCQINIAVRPDGSHDWGNPQRVPFMSHEEIEKFTSTGVLPCICVSPWDTEETVKRTFEEGFPMITSNYPSHTKRILEEMKLI